MIITILSTVFVLGVLVFIHELGHVLAAKAFKIRVERFSMGFPPRMIGKKIGDTDYCLSWIPFGGYAKIAGMVDESMDSEALKNPPQPWEYRSRPWIQRFIVVFAGPFMNIVFTFLVFFFATIFTGINELDTSSRIGSLMPDYPAAAAGLLAGDEIQTIDNNPVNSWKDITILIKERKTEEIGLTVKRADSLFSLILTPKIDEISLNGKSITVPRIGISPAYIKHKAGPLRAIVLSSKAVGNLTKLIVDSFYRLITGKESIKNVAGPVGIAKMAGDSARAGAGVLFSFMALLSINLAILNLLPIPVLDGGHLFILCIEGVIRKEISTKAKLVVQQIGMFLLLGLMVFVIYNDIIKAVH